MPITIQEIREHQDYYAIRDLELMSKSDYKKTLEQEAFFWIDHHDFIIHQLSGEIIATNKQQLDMLIEHLKSFRECLPNQIELK